MIRDFEKQYVLLYQKLQRQQWENYFGEAQNDLSLIDNEIYTLTSSYRGKIKGFDRKSEIAKWLIERECVDKDPRVSVLRNRIDDFENYDTVIPKQLKKQGRFYLGELSRRMKTDVLALMKLRNSLAMDSGYPSYVDLVLETEEVNKEELFSLLNDYLDTNLPKAQWLIKEYGITFAGWFDDLDRISKEITGYNPHILIDELLESLGFSEVVDKTKVEIRKDGFTGYCTEISPHDIRLVVEPLESLDNLRTLFHELGHAVSYGLNDEKGIVRILPASRDEFMAVVFEYIAAIILLGPNERRRLNELMLLEYTRCAISALFEFDLWENSDQASELYQKYYEKLGFKIEDHDLWALDSFRSIDPVYIHNYVMGASVAEKLTNHLNELYEDNYRLWGSWLRKNVYSKGNIHAFRSKVEGCYGPN